MITEAQKKVIRRLQHELNQFHGAHLLRDGIPGPATARAFLVARRQGGWDPAGDFLDAEALLAKHTGALLDDMDSHLASCLYRRFATECTCGLAKKDVIR